MSVQSHIQTRNPFIRKIKFILSHFNNSMSWIYLMCMSWLLTPWAHMELSRSQNPVQVFLIESLMSWWITHTGLLFPAHMELTGSNQVFLVLKRLAHIFSMSMHNHWWISHAGPSKRTTSIQWCLNSYTIKYSKNLAKQKPAHRARGCMTPTK